MSGLTIDKCFIFRITHVDNLPWLLTNGICCRNSPQRDPHFREIGNPELINRRSTRVVPIPPGGTLSDYVPFYFTPYSPMLLNIKTGYNGTKLTPLEEIVILVSSLYNVQQNGIRFVFTDRHAYLEAAVFNSDLANLSLIDWGILQRRDFKRDANDPGKVERYQAEALVYRKMPISTLLGMFCYSPRAKEIVQGYLKSANVTLSTEVRPGWYV